MEWGVRVGHQPLFASGLFCDRGARVEGKWPLRMGWSSSEPTIDAFYDRGSTFPLNCVLSDGSSLTQNRRNANLVSKNDVLVYLGHGIVQTDAI